jgi:hypothetical protein
MSSEEPSSNGWVWNIYQYMKSYWTTTEKRNENKEKGTEEGEEVDKEQEPISYETVIVTPLDVVLRESELSTRKEIFEFLMKNKGYKTIRFFVSNYYSIYLLCYFIFDILDILSNELFHLQTKIVFCLDPRQRPFFTEEFKKYIKGNVSLIQKNKILPLYIKFIDQPSYHLEYSVHFDQRFHILFLKESEDDFSIQRLHFSIDL